MSKGICVSKFTVFNSGIPVVFSAIIYFVKLLLGFFLSFFKRMTGKFAELSQIPQFPNHDWNQQPLSHYHDGCNSVEVLNCIR